MIVFWADPIGFLCTQRDHTTLFQVGDRPARNTGKIAQFMNCRLTLLQQKLHGIVHAGRTLLSGLCPRRRIVSRQRQVGQLYRLVLYRTSAQRLLRDHTPLFQRTQCCHNPLAKRFLKFRRLMRLLRKKAAHRLLFVRNIVRKSLLRQLPYHLMAVPHGSRQDGANGVIKGTKVSLPHP